MTKNQFLDAPTMLGVVVHDEPLDPAAPPLRMASSFPGRRRSRRSCGSRSGSPSRAARLK